MLWKSQNGRWGVEVVDARITRESLSYAKQAAFPGQAAARGKAAGTSVYAVDPAAAGFVVVSERAGFRAVSGCTVLESCGLQGGNEVAVVNAVEGAVWRTSGYKGRTPQVWKLEGGKILQLEGLAALEATQAPAAPVDPKAALREERAKLVARIAEIDALLAG